MNGQIVSIDKHISLPVTGGRLGGNGPGGGTGGLRFTGGGVRIGGGGGSQEGGGPSTTGRLCWERQHTRKIDIFYNYRVTSMIKRACLLSCEKPFSVRKNS